MFGHGQSAVHLFEFGHMVNDSLNPARILVVDDEQDILRAARLLLKRHFASVDTLSDPGLHCCPSWFGRAPSTSCCST